MKQIFLLAVVFLTACSVKLKNNKDDTTFGCGFAKSFSGWSSSITLKITKRDLEQFVSLIQSKRIADPTQFWKTITTGEAELLSTWVIEAYEKTSSKSYMREHDIKYYENIVAVGLIKIANDPAAKKYKSYHFAHSAGVRKAKSISFTTYRVVLSVVDSEAAEPAVGYHTCKVE